MLIIWYIFCIFSTLWLWNNWRANWLTWSHPFASLKVATMTWLTAMEYMCYKWPRICSVCRNHDPILSSFTTNHRIYSSSNKTGATCGTGTVYTSGSTPVFSGVHVARSLLFCVMFCRSLFVLFRLVIMLSVLLQITASDYPCGIVKLFWDKFFLKQIIPCVYASAHL